MLILTVVILACALAWLARRHWLVCRGVRLLAHALQKRRPHLDEDGRFSQFGGSWKTLVATANQLVHELAELTEQKAGQLTQLETTLGNLQEAVLIVDRDNYLLLANDALRRMFPSSGSPLRQRVEAVLRSGDFLAFLDRVRRGGTQAQQEMQFLEASGPIWVEVSGAIVPQPTKEPNGPWTLCVLHDITRQKHLESVRRDFVANVSHELKTPISVIKGYAETLVEDHASMSPDNRAQFVATIHRHADRLSAIVDDLLTLSRLESAVPGVHPVRQSLSEFLRATHVEYRQQLEASGHLLALSLPVEDLWVELDPMRIAQVMANLLGNAQKYTPRGSRVELGASQGADPGEAELWVSDNGPGIPPADLPRIFERFYRVEKGRSRDKGGTGLGLSIAKHVVQLHRGRIWAESTVGQGTRIAFTLPMRSTAPSGPENAPPGAAPSAPAADAPVRP